MLYLLQAEELIKKEMITMLHYDAVYTPTPSQLGIAPGAKKNTPSQKGVLNQAQHLAYLEQYPYGTFSEDDLEQVCTTWPLWLSKIWLPTTSSNIEQENVCSVIC